MATHRTKRILWSTLVIGVLLAAAATVTAFSLGKYEKVKVSGGVVSIPVSKVSEKARFFKYEDNGKEITFFAVKAPDGSYKTAFDACDSCYRAKKGYEQQGDRMNCNNCNQKFAINRLGPNTTGGCNPGFLPHELNGGVISIRVDDLKAGARYF
jgi:uncharacterized membrane protein